MTSSASAVAERPVCAICQDDILPNANVSKLNCDHQYHRDCLQPWLDANHNTCPLDRKKITSINGTATAIEQPEESEEHFHLVVIESPLREARALYQSIRAIHNPSIHSSDPVERTAAKTQSVFFSIFGRPPQ